MKCFLAQAVSTEQLVTGRELLGAQRQQTKSKGQKAEKGEVQGGEHQLLMLGSSKKGQNPATIRKNITVFPQFFGGVFFSYKTMMALYCYADVISAGGGRNSLRDFEY